MTRLLPRLVCMRQLRAGSSAADTGMTMGADDSFTIDELAQAAGMTPRNVRAYRTKGLLPPPIREGRASSYRVAHLRRLRHIKELREAGLPLKLIMEAAQRGDDLSPRGPLSRLTASFVTGTGSDGSGGNALLSATLGARDVIRIEDDPGTPDVPQGSPLAVILQRLAAHGITQSTLLVMLMRVSRSGRALSSELSDLLCSDLLKAHPDELPAPVLTDTLELALALTDQVMREELPLA